MIQEVEIRNFKSITELTLPLGRVNVLIGANGSGKSNILEAITFGAAAANNKLDNEFLVTRGIRVSDDPRFMRSAFDKKNVETDIVLSFSDANDKFAYALQKNNENLYSSWIIIHRILSPIVSSDFNPYNGIEKLTEEELIQMRNWIVHTQIPDEDANLNQLQRQLINHFIKLNTGPEYLRNFLVYSPENSALRTFEVEGQIQPLGIRGEGLFKLLKVMSANDKSGIEELKEKLSLIDWFSDFNISADLSMTERNLSIKDRYLDNALAYFDQKSANEGFLFLLFYFCLFISKETPSFFAVDNVDASLNPKLCSQLMKELVQLAKAKGKQVVFTTHNPAILDGLDLTDDEQRLFVVSRNRSGHTRVKRIPVPQMVEGQAPVRLSEAFLRGYLGGLPDNF